VTSKALAIVGGVNNLVQCSPSATSPDLDESIVTSLLYSTDSFQQISAVLGRQWNITFLNVSHVASLHVSDAYGLEFARVFIQEAEKAKIDVFSVSFDLDYEHHAKDAVQLLKKSGRRYIFGCSKWWVFLVGISL
jgi:ABC-type branched-subunit amino acid transport system substrate-binding protein